MYRLGWILLLTALLQTLGCPPQSVPSLASTKQTMAEVVAEELTKGAANGTSPVTKGTID